MKSRKGYRISGWSILALVAAPFAIVAAVAVVAALDQRQPTENTGLQQFVTKMVQGLEPAKTPVADKTSE